MLNLNEIVGRLNAAPVRFKELMEQERYSEAKWLFYDCMATAVLIEMDEAVMDRLFGERGAFEPELVKIAYEKAGGGLDRTAEDYAEDARTRSNVRFSLYKKRVLERLNAIPEGVENSNVS